MGKVGCWRLRNKWLYRLSIKLSKAECDHNRRIAKTAQESDDVFIYLACYTLLTMKITGQTFDFFRYVLYYITVFSIESGYSDSRLYICGPLRPVFFRADIMLTLPTAQDKRWWHSI